MSELPANVDPKADPEADKAHVDAEEAAIEATRAPLLDHLMELRDRLLWSVIALIVTSILCFAVWKVILAALLLPYEHAVIAVKGIEALQGEMRLQYTAPLETLITQLKVSFFGGLMLSFPVVATQVYRFVAPGLYSHEKKAFLPFLLLAPVLFLMGAAMAYFVVMPMVMQFSLNQELDATAGNVGVYYQGKVSEYVGMITSLVLGFGFCFQLPVVQLLLGRAGLVSSEFWFENARYAILGVFIVAAIVTPPDPVSQLALAVPLVILYYVGAWLVKMTAAKDDDAGAAQSKWPEG